MLGGLTKDQIFRRKNLYAHIEDVYNSEIREGILPQQARDNLPTCLKTEIIWTANLREWRHILKLRTSKAAHPQMREIATMIAIKLAALLPSFFNEFSQKGDPNEQ
jgi:thymidylate synthase (FAD)